MFRPSVLGERERESQTFVLCSLFFVFSPSSALSFKRPEGRPNVDAMTMLFLISNVVQGFSMDELEVILSKRQNPVQCVCVYLCV